MSKIIKITTENFDEDIMKDGVVALVDFYADWCGPCKMFAPVFEKVASEHEDVNFYKVNVDEAGELASMMGVMNIPTIVRFDGGEETARKIGSMPKPAFEEFVS